jgi:hypothetical protein
MIKKWVFCCQITVLQYFLDFSSVSDVFQQFTESQKIGVPLTLDGQKRFFFGIPGHLETLKTGRDIATIPAFMTNSASKTALF